MSVGERGIYTMLEDFIGVVDFQWCSQNEIANIGILVLQRVCKNNYGKIKEGHCNCMGIKS